MSKYTSDEIDFIRNHSGKLKLKEISLRLGRSMSSIKRKCATEGISIANVAFYTEKGEFYLLTKKGILSSEVMANELGRSVRGIKEKLLTLRLDEFDMKSSNMSKITWE